MSWKFDFTEIEILQFPCLSDNYGFLVHDKKSGQCVSIDTPDASAISAALEEYGWQLTHIWNTHWHPDHTGGNLALKEKWGCQIIGPDGERDRIPGADRLVGEDEIVTLGGTKARIIETPGHTSGHIVYYIEDENVVFVGDTLFSLGCGRLFEGTAEQMWTSLQKLRILPDSTSIFCAHEYTLANARFAKTVDPKNPVLAHRIEEITHLRQNGSPTVPTTIGKEKKTNPFLRADIATVMAALDMTDDKAVEVFAEIRRRKDHF